MRERRFYERCRCLRRRLDGEYDGFCRVWSCLRRRCGRGRRYAAILFAACCLLLCACAKEGSGRELLYEAALGEEQPGVRESGPEPITEENASDGSSSEERSFDERSIGGSASDGESPGGSSAEAAAKSGQECLYVYVCGAVEKPGVYALASGARLWEAVDAAGGFSEDADESSVNLASKASDGQMVYIPTQEERLREAQSSQASGLVNINTASEEQLMTLPGIGEAKARSIIAYREAKGGFQSVEELKEIEGIKEKVYSKLKDFITIE